MRSSTHFINYLLCTILFIYTSLSFADDTARYKPFILASAEKTSLDDSMKSVTNKLKQAGFTIVGQYSPFAGTTILGVTNKALLENAGQSKLGGFGAVQRVSLTQNGEQVQISYTNPIYMSHVYRMKNDLSSVKADLQAALGMQESYGPKEGLSKADLRDYQYKWLMPHFTDQLELMSYANQKIALSKINELLQKPKIGVHKVYQVDIPGKDETVIGVNMTGKQGNECSGDQYIMSRIDFKSIKSSGHLPYEIVVSKGKIYTLPAEFRIAINFPDLSMMGDNSFASIMCAPGAIKTALSKAVGGEIEY